MNLVNEFEKYSADVHRVLYFMYIDASIFYGMKSKSFYLSGHGPMASVLGGKSLAFSEAAGVLAHGFNIQK